LLGKRNVLRLDHYFCTLQLALEQVSPL